jgi:predicted small metal-binding protein
MQQERHNPSASCKNGTKFLPQGLNEQFGSRAAIRKEDQSVVHVNAAKKETTELKSVSCDPQCGLKVQSHDEQELTDIVVAHARKAHNMDVTAKDVKVKMKTVKTKETKKEKS